VLAKVEKTCIKSRKEKRT